MSLETCEVGTQEEINTPVRPQNKHYLMVDYKKAFIKLFQETARYKHRYELFRDWITVCSIEFENVGHRINGDAEQFQKKEEQYKKIFAGYELKDRQNMITLFCHMVMALEIDHHDFLGDVFMALELGSDAMGQFFTPSHISNLMAKMSIGDSVEQLKDKPYISLSEPACGAGGMVIATAKHMIESGFNPNTQLLAVCTDIDVVAARMCYVQLSMLGIPAIVNIGNTLSMAINTTLYTPFLYVNYWRFKDFFNPPDNLSYIERGNITDISNHGKYVGRIIELQGRGHSCGKHIHQSFSDAVQALVARKKNLNA